ncbi:MAG TPA: FHA domain-containing protein [Myxococcales bacterium]|jgi:pSer/pThr/pTyr-binding forkhead associated (FHA) protein
MSSAPARNKPLKPGAAGRLVIVSADDGDGTVFPIILKHTLVGRIDSAQLLLDDLSVSRLHARLDVEPSGVFVIDLDSREGTWINGVAVRRAKLVDGDHLSFGDAVVRYEL